MTETCAYTRDILVDLETLGTNGRAPVLSIGAVEFDLEGKSTGSYRTFYANVGLQTSLDAGLKPDAGAFYWWLEQGEQARKRLSEMPRLTLNEALHDLWSWIGLYGYEFRLWAHGANFDPGILESAYATLSWNNGRVPWKYNAVRDTRTLFHVAGLDWDTAFAELVGEGQHDALQDAIASAKLVQRAWSMVRSAVAPC